MEQPSSSSLFMPVLTVGIIAGLACGGYYFYKNQLIDELSSQMGNEGKRFALKAKVLNVFELRKAQEYLGEINKSKAYEAKAELELNSKLTPDQKAKGAYIGAGESPRFTRYMKKNGAEINVIMAKVNGVSI